MAIRFFIILCVTFFFSCASTRVLEENFFGAYWNQEDNTQISILKGNGFIYENLSNKGDLALYTCCDTISYGSWKKINGNIIELSTPEYLNIPITRMQVQEFETKNVNTLEFVIESPLEEFYRKNPSNRRDVNYKIELFTNDIQFELAQVNKLYKDNRIIIDIPEKTQVKGFVVEIIPTSFFSGQNIGFRRWSTLDYEIQEQEFSKFVIDLPDLSYDYLTYLRLYRDYVLFKKKGVLLWNGKKYKRK